MALGDFGISVSANTVARLLDHMGYSLRVNRKQLATDASPDRNEQFLYIRDLRDRFQRQGWPIISVDTKKRELVGAFKNPGARWDRSPRLVNDHDFRSDAIGVAIPHGIYDLLANRRCVTVGVSARHAGLRRWRHCPLVAPRRLRPVPTRTPSPSAQRDRRQEWLPLPGLEN